jgi:hypothetical protein
MKWHGLVNGLTCPRGRPYGEAHFLLSDESLHAIDLTGPLELEITHEDGKLTFPDYYVTRTEAVSRDSSKPPHWIVLADRRYVFERIAGNKRYNFRKGTDSEWVQDTLNSDTPWTWDEIIQDLWSLLPGTIPSVAAITATSTPENLDFYGMSAWRAINQVLTAIGCASVFNPLTEEFSIVHLSDSQSGLSALREANKSRVLWDFRPESPANVNYPAKVSVTFQKVPGKGEQPWLEQPDVEEASLSSGGLAGTSWPIEDTMFSWDDNSADRTARAEEIADAFVGLLKPLASPWGSVYAGALEFHCGEEVTEVQWSSDGYRGMQTVVRHSYAEIDWPTLPRIFGGGGGAKIQYVIDSLRTASSGADLPYFGLKIATVTVQVAPCEQPELIGTQVDVVDHSGCVFDLDGADLEGVWGWASQGIALSRDAGAEEGALTPCHWAADDRCCAASEIGG